MVAEYHNQSKLRFWCQMVLPLVYDDSLSYMELLNKVVNYLNNCIQDVGNCETNIELLLDAFESLQDYVNEMVEDISPEIESVIDQMIENGDFTEILTDALNTVVAPEYDEETTYLQYEYVLYEGNLYRANTTTSGEFDPTKWTEKTIAQDLTVLERYVYGLTANDVPYDGTQTYDAGSTGKAIKDLAAEVDSLDAGDIAYNSSTTYNNATVGKELVDLKGAISKDNMSQTLIKTDEVASDLNSAKFGYLVFNTTSSNRPSGASYGVVLTHQGSTWKYQIAVDTNGNVYRRRNINNGGWTSWEKDGAYFESLGTIFTISNSYSTDFEISEGVGYKCGNLIYVSLVIHKTGTTTTGEKLNFATCSVTPTTLATFACEGLAGSVTIRTNGEVRLVVQSATSNWFTVTGVFITNS